MRTQNMLSVALVIGSLAGCSSGTSTPIASTDAAGAGDAVADSAATDGGAAEGLHYYSDPCGSGDPLGCSFQMPVDVPDPTYKTCAELGLKEMDSCATEGARCVLVPARKEGADGGGCSQRAEYLTCLSKKRDTGAGGCPVSTRAAKTKVHYLDDAEKAKLSKDVLSLQMASYDYKRQEDGPSPSIGFILEDSPNSPFVLRDHSRVDMYSYVSSLVVTVQEQQRQIDALKARVAQMEQAPRRPPPR